MGCHERSGREKSGHESRGRMCRSRGLCHLDGGAGIPGSLEILQVHRLLRAVGRPPAPAAPRCSFHGASSLEGSLGCGRAFGGGLCSLPGILVIQDLRPRARASQGLGLVSLARWLAFSLSHCSLSLTPFLFFSACISLSLSTSLLLSTSLSLPASPSLRRECALTRWRYRCQASHSAGPLLRRGLLRCSFFRRGLAGGGVGGGDGDSGLLVAWGGNLLGDGARMASVGQHGASVATVQARQRDDLKAAVERCHCNVKLRDEAPRRGGEAGEAIGRAAVGATVGTAVGLAAVGLAAVGATVGTAVGLPLAGSSGYGVVPGPTLGERHLGADQVSASCRSCKTGT